MRRQARGLLASTLSVGLLLCPLARADDDVVVMQNGDHLTGEIKSLDRGLLRFDTDATGTISVKWEFVAELSSSQSFEITLDDGRRTLATLARGANAARVELETESAPIDVRMASIVRMTPIEGRLVDRIDMGIDVGYDLTKANDLARATLSYDFGYRSERRFVDLNVDLARSASGDSPASMRANAAISYRRLLEGREWEPEALAMLERNDELGLSRRVAAGGGMSHWLKDTNSSRASFSGGLVYTSENEFDAPTSQDSLEAAIGLNLDWFRYVDPELDVSVRLTAFQRLSDKARTRGNLDVDFRWELIQDFFWGLTIYYSFNTSPVGDVASTTDYGLATTLGWSF